MSNQVTPEGMTKIIFSGYEEVRFEKSEADDWLREIGKRIGKNLSFKAYRFMKEKYQFLMGMFDENGNVLVSDAQAVPAPCCKTMELKEVYPVYLGFFVNSGTMWDMSPDETKMECLSYLKRKFYIDYLIEIVSEKSMMLDKVFSHYTIYDGKAFDPIPEAESLAGLVFKMDLMKYGKR